MFHVPNEFRLRQTSMASSDEDGNNGVFIIPVRDGVLARSGPEKFITQLAVIASDGEGWEHCSVSLKHRVPKWSEMCLVKSLFWDDEDCVVQYHPPKSSYVNIHENVLHLWRPVGIEIPRPPTILV